MKLLINNYDKMYYDRMSHFTYSLWATRNESKRCTFNAIAIELFDK